MGSILLLVALVIGRGSTYQPACSVIRQMERNIARLTNNVVTLEEKLDKASRIVAYTTWLIAGKTKAIANQERKMESQKRTIAKFQRRRRRRSPGDATSEMLLIQNHRGLSLLFSQFLTLRFFFVLQY